MAFLEFIGILVLAQVGGYGSGFMSVKINNILVIAFGKLWNRRKELVEKWFEIDRKNEQIVSDITQKEPSSEILTASKEDQFNRSF